MGTTAVTESTQRRSNPTAPRPTLVWLVPLLALLAMIAVGLGVSALATAPSTSQLQRRITALETNVSDLRSRTDSLQQILARTRAAERRNSGRIASLEADSATTAPAAQMNRIAGTVNSVRVCASELQREVAALRNVGRWLGGANGSGAARLSPACTSLLSSGR